MHSTLRLFLLLLCLSGLTAKASVDSVRQELKQVLQASERFEQAKLRKIEGIKSSLRRAHTLEQQEDLLLQATNGIPLH